MSEMGNLLQYGALGLLLIVLVGVFLLLRDFFRQQATATQKQIDDSQKQLDFIQEIARSSIASQEAHTASWRQMTKDTLDTITGFTQALGKINDTITAESRARREEHREILKGLGRESL